MDMPTIVIYGPKGCGKTHHAEKLRAHFGYHCIVDPWDGRTPLPNGALALTNTHPAVDTFADRLLGKKLCVLAWAVETIELGKIGTALRNWLALCEEERWWLFGMTAFADIASGFECTHENSALFPFQRAIVKWALRRGRAAVFADTGMGKTAMQCEWAHRVC